MAKGTFADLLCPPDELHDLQVVKIHEGRIYYHCTNCLFTGILNMSSIEEGITDGGH